MYEYYPYSVGARRTSPQVRGEFASSLENERGVDGGCGRAVRCAPPQWIVSSLLDVSLASCKLQLENGQGGRTPERTLETNSVIT